MEEHSFGYWLRLRRKALDLTQDALADRVGCSVGMIRKIESEERRPSAQIVERLAEIFDIPTVERAAFLRFARGDWRAAPIGNLKTAPWLASQLSGQNASSNSQVHLATFLFTDIEASAKLWEIAPEKMKVALQRHHEILEKAITSNGGSVFQIVGDAFCAAFPTVQFAISAAVTTQRELHQEPWDTPSPIRVRMGIHTGEAERSSNPSILGGYASNQTLNRVARILNAAHGGQVLLSLATKDLVKDSLPANTELRDMGEHYLKNLMYPEHLFQLNIAGLPAEFPPLNTLTHRHNLPVQVTSFIAREKEIALVHEYLSKDDIRLVTLLGPPGIGKTRLSIEAGRALLHDFPDGVFFVALAPLDDPNLIAAATAQALGYVGTKNVSTTEQLKEGIGDKRLLLVLDNCEHLIENVASRASELLLACSHLKILATSRETLRISGEWLYPVPALDVPAESSAIDMETAANFPALALFAERAHAVRPDFALNAENIKIVSAICNQLDGLPLAIELIAARMRLMSAQALLDHLSAQFILTTDGMRAASHRQRTLHNAIDWSYKLLPLEEQKLFAYLSVFSGGFTLEAVESMFSGKITGKPLPHLIASLLDKSLIKFAPDLKASDDTRYTMLVTIQEYARERLQEMRAETEIRNEHLVYFLDVAEKARKEMRGPNQVEWLHRLLGLRDNLRSALDRAIETGQIEAALQMARNLYWFWFVHSDHNEARYSFARVLALSGVSRYPSLYAEVLIQLAHHIAAQTNGLRVMEAKPLVEQALVIARAHDDKRNIGRALCMLGYVLTFEYEFMMAQATMAQSVLEESMELFREVNDEWEYAQAVITLARNALRQNELALAFTLHEQALALFRKIGDRYFQSWALYWMGVLEAKQGDVKSGIAKLQEALMLARQLDSRYAVGGGLWRLSELAQRTGDPARTVRLYWAAKNILDSVGSWNEEDASNFENVMASCRAALSESAFAEAEVQGRAMTMEQAIEYALDWSASR